MIDLGTAERLLDFNHSIDNRQRADDQLEGAVALHNVLDHHGIAYLADEVGMGKTYVALGVVALLRHFQPRCRVLIIAPRENIQHKWQREQHLFVKNNVRVADMRVRMPDGKPVRPLVHCGNLIQLIRESAVAPERDFFMRMPSFSLPLSDDRESKRRFRDRLRAELPWLPDEVLDLRANSEVLKDRFAQVLNTALPVFDLVIVDEAHNLKHGFDSAGSSRNRVMATALGHPRADYEPRLRRWTGSRAHRVLLLSATPVDDNYTQLWRQLDLFGRGDSFRVLSDPAADEEAKRAAVSEFLIRRVTSFRVAGGRLTKNLYRREWRAGGVERHDEPVPRGNDRQELTVALVQKKVGELLGHERFGASFQIGMLASFESFLETTKQRLDSEAPLEPEHDGNFDGSDQTDDDLEREGVDVRELNGLARDHRLRFGADLVHPKMDALATKLAASWRRGEKALVFVRRVASVGEIKRRVDRAYDSWLFEWLHTNLPERHHGAIASAISDYREEQRKRGAANLRLSLRPHGDVDDPGDVDTFFSYFFRGQGPKGFVSGATIQDRFRTQSGALATFFEDNYVMALLGAPPGQVVEQLAAHTQIDEEALRTELRARSSRYLSGAQTHPRGARFTAAQAAALELLAGKDQRASVIYNELYRTRVGEPALAQAEPRMLETPTVFTELRRRPALRRRLWPESTSRDPSATFREEFVRAQLLSASARLGHPFLDLYAVVAAHLGSLKSTAAVDPTGDIIAAYLDRLEEQSSVPLDDRGWSAFDELEALAENHQLILAVNMPAERGGQPLADIRVSIAGLLRRQHPVAGMSGSVNQALVRQFRMPGYPLVMISTDLLQEGEDLHTFCSTVHHYGLAWTPSALEQRTGRIDRVRSQTERRLTALEGLPEGDDLLQVHYPHLPETVERLQVRRVLRRADEFMRLMHADLTTSGDVEGRVDIAREFLESDDVMPQPPRGELTSAFGVRKEHLRGEDRPLAVDDSTGREQLQRFARLVEIQLPEGTMDWENPQKKAGLLMGTVRLPSARVQPCSLQLGWWEDHLIVRCVSPIGLVATEGELSALAATAAREPVKLGVVAMGPEGTYDVTVEEDVLLGEQFYDAGRVAALVDRVSTQADALELRHLSARDRRLSEFHADLTKDLHHAR